MEEELHTCIHYEGDNLDIDPHTCPYAEDIYGDNTLCMCCEDCEYECAMDI